MVKDIYVVLKMKILITAMAAMAETDGLKPVIWNQVTIGIYIYHIILQKS